MIGGGSVRGRVDADGRLVEAEPRLMALHRAAGGEEGGPLAVPQIAALARLARRLNIVISRGAVAAEGESDLELWVRAEPKEGLVELAISGWTARPARGPAPAPDSERQADFLRAGADWMWETDAALRLTTVTPAAAAAAGRTPAQLVGQPLTRLFRLEEGEEGDLPLLTALAEQRRFDGQLAGKGCEQLPLRRRAGEAMLLGAAQKQGKEGGVGERAAAFQHRRSDRQAGRGKGGPDRLFRFRGKAGGERRAQVVLDVADQPPEQVRDGDSLAIAEPQTFRQSEVGHRGGDARVGRREQLRRAVQLTPARAHFGHRPSIGLSGLKRR